VCEEPNEARTDLLVERIDPHELACVRKRLGGSRLETFDEGAEDLNVQGAGVLALGGAPGAEFVEVDEVEAFQELTFEHGLEFEESLGRDGVYARRQLLAHPLPIE